MTKFPERLKELREARGLSQAKIAEELGLSRFSVYAYEKSKSSPTLDGLNILADYFDVTLDYLLGRTDEPG